MENSKFEIKWPPRLPKAKLRRLYEGDAAGLLDEDLVDDVGYTLYMRCRSIVAIAEARRGRVQCPQCARDGNETIVARQADEDEPMVCAVCSWQCTWREYRMSYRRKQLNPGGAEPIFQAFVTNFARARTPREKMLAIDRVIHEFHYYNQQPCRATGVNLIDGKLTDVVAFLNTLTYGEGTPSETNSTRDEWRTKLDSIPWLRASAAVRIPRDGD